MSTNKVIDLQFNDLFTDDNVNIYREILSNEGLENIQLNIEVPFIHIKNEYKNEQVVRNLTTAPFKIYVNKKLITKHIRYVHGSDISKEEAVEYALEMLLKTQCDMVNNLFIFH